MKESVSLSVVIPVYNEKKIIRQSLLFLDELLDPSFKDYEIIAVDDGSVDDTGKILQELCEQIEELRVIRNELNQGLGGALRIGYAQASKDLILYLDADMPIDYSQISRLVDILKATKADIVTGFRRNRSNESLARKVCSDLYNRFIRAIFCVKTQDINFACKLFRRQALKDLDLKSQGSFISAETLVKAQYLGYRIQQIDLEYFSRQDGSYSRLFKFQAIAYILFELMKYFPEIMKLKRQKKAL